METTQKVGQEQIHGLLFSNKLSWQSIIYELINSEQLDPWDIDLVLLTNKYLERVREIEEANLFVSSKVLYAASLLLRIKSEILLNHYIPGLDEILFGKKEEKKYIQERIEFDEEIPGLVPRTPLPRFRKVTLKELLVSLGKAINTENRRIKKVVIAKNYELETAIALPRAAINVREKIKEVYYRLKEIFSARDEKISFSEFVDSGDKIENFVPLLHLDNQNKIVLEQENHFEDIWILLKSIYGAKNKEELERLRREVELAIQEEQSGNKERKNN